MNTPTTFHPDVRACHRPSRNRHHPFESRSHPPKNSLSTFYLASFSGFLLHKMSFGCFQDGPAEELCHTLCLWACLAAFWTRYNQLHRAIFRPLSSSLYIKSSTWSSPRNVCVISMICFFYLVPPYDMNRERQGRLLEIQLLFRMLTIRFLMPRHFRHRSPISWATFPTRLSERAPLSDIARDMPPLSNIPSWPVSWNLSHPRTVFTVSTSTYFGGGKSVELIGRLDWLTDNGHMSFLFLPLFSR